MCVYVCMCVCVYVSVCVCMCVYVCVCMCVCMCMHVCVHVLVCACELMCLNMTASVNNISAYACTYTCTCITLALTFLLDVLNNVLIFTRFSSFYHPDCVTVLVALIADTPTRLQCPSVGELMTNTSRGQLNASLRGAQRRGDTASNCQQINAFRQ